ncbi:predicted protein [Naegleria gruberi]|uniref:Predicted protein n=1 Tax=Naegleria gruberi TaxID=5762 RepID=D2VH44_NAEGR|nr:uncharacterized protein NAEGRDRAFT_49537 [Naegleria gruberi]EFC43916.1 predicted protein [Naegleria gruberi]|eukprot:XP_002676660.1 predicted protein [Naegleria gruberi strain NEG-M]
MQYLLIARKQRRSLCRFTFQFESIPTNPHQYFSSSFYCCCCFEYSVNNNKFSQTRKLEPARIFTNNTGCDTKQQIESQNSAWMIKKSPTTEDKLSKHPFNNTTPPPVHNVNSWKLQQHQFSKHCGSKTSRHSKRFHDSLLQYSENTQQQFVPSVIAASSSVQTTTTNLPPPQSSQLLFDKRRKSFATMTNNNNQNKIKTHHNHHAAKIKSQSTSTYNTIDTFPTSYIYSILDKLSPSPDFKSYIEIKWITTITSHEIQVELFRPRVLNVDESEDEATVAIDDDGLVSSSRKFIKSKSKHQKFLQTNISRLVTTTKKQENNNQTIDFKDEESNSGSSSGEEDSTTDVSSSDSLSSYHEKSMSASSGYRNIHSQSPATNSESDDCSSSSGQESQSKSSSNEQSHSSDMKKTLSENGQATSKDMLLNSSTTANNDEEIHQPVEQQQQSMSNESSQKKKKDFLVQGGVMRVPTALTIFSKLFNSMKSKISLNKLVFTPFISPSGKSNHSTTEDYQGGSSGNGTSSSSERLSSDGGNSSNSSGDEREDVSSEEDQNEDAYPMPPVNVLTVSGSGESSGNSQNGGGSSNSSERRNNSTSNNGGGNSSNNNNNGSREASSNSMNNSSSGSEEFSGGSDSDDENISFATVQIIDGSQKEKNGIKYWVQRNVITIQVISSFVFDTCTVYCTKEGNTETKVMETLSFVDSFTKLNPSKVAEVLKNAKCTLSIDEDDVYEAQFRKKLPFTSGRPETQKLIWISAEFSMSNKIIKKVNSSKFYVCSRPQDLRAIGNNPVATSTTNVSSSSQSSSAMPNTNNMNNHHETSSVNQQQQHSFSARTKVANVQSPSMNSMTPFQNDGYRHSSNNSQDNSSSNNIHNSTTNRPNLQNYNNNNSSNSGSMIHHHYSNSNGSISNNSNNQQTMFPSNQYPTHHHPFTSPNTSPIYHHHPQQTTSNNNSYQSSPQQSNISLQLTSIHPNRGPLNGQQEVTILGNFDSIKKEGNSVRVMFGLQDSPNIAQVLSDRIVCTVPERIVPGLVRIEVVTKSIPQLSSFGDVFYTYYRPEHNQQQQENENQASDNEGFSLNRPNKSHIYHPYK